MKLSNKIRDLHLKFSSSSPQSLSSSMSCSAGLEWLEQGKPRILWPWPWLRQWPWPWAHKSCSISRDWLIRVCELGKYFPRTLLNMHFETFFSSLEIVRKDSRLPVYVLFSADHCTIYICIRRSTKVSETCQLEECHLECRLRSLWISRWIGSPRMGYTPACNVSSMRVCMYQCMYVQRLCIQIGLTRNCVSDLPSHLYELINCCVNVHE